MSNQQCTNNVKRFHEFITASECVELRLQLLLIPVLGCTTSSSKSGCSSYSGCGACLGLIIGPLVTHPTCTVGVDCVDMCGQKYGLWLSGAVV